MKPKIRRKEPRRVARPKPRIDYGEDKYPVRRGSLMHLRTKAKHDPTAQLQYMVLMMVAQGITQPNIARIMGVDVSTLRKHYKEELETGGDRVNYIVASKLARTAMFGKGDTALRAQQFWLRTRGKGQFKETTASELSGPNGTPIPIEAILNDEERAIRFMQLLSNADQLRRLPPPSIDVEAKEKDE
jgi:DNA-binding CsgD family transcriptional regulator